ncbi:phage tail assembly protein [Paenibacillus tyrfis]|uniref:phage tail assembly protein n=1 Tax=Paenibacillus tyrfis TaxID=1501230 RepID=UPI000692134F|nr:phage tail assembly protein [Paenibacillus tyrfis]
MTEKQEQVQEHDGSVFTLRFPIEFEGEHYSSFKLDFERLSGDDIIVCERQYQARQPDFTYVKETSKEYQSYIVARAAGVQVELIRKLSASDFSRVTLRAQNFLLGSD